ncbi:MAG: MoaD/ThiS family protein [Caldiserica bacterium]|nr:MoaD/ThiS family protein [Caldisericota bacterium]
MQVKFDNQVKEWQKRKRVKDILEAFGLNREEVIVVRNDALLTENDWVEVEDEVEIWRVVSGGSSGD